MAVEQPFARQEEGSIGHRTKLRPGAEILADPRHLLVRDEMLCVTARTHDNPINLWCVAHMKVRLDTDAIRRADLLAGSDREPGIAAPAGQRVGCAQRLDDRTESHQRKVRKHQYRKADFLRIPHLPLKVRPPRSPRAA